MKKDIDRIMQRQNVDALLVSGAGQHNPPMVYLTGGAHLTQAVLVKKRGSDAVLYHYPMERDEAASTGLGTFNINNFGLDKIRRQTGGDELETSIEIYRRILAEHQIESGRVAVFGNRDAGESYALFSRLQEKLPQIKFVGQVSDSILLNAMSTKEEDEIDRIRRMGKITTTVVENVANFLTNHRVEDRLLIKEDGSNLTIGEVKRFIGMRLAELGAEIPEGVIFAIGRDAGVPHSTGNDVDRVRLGETIVFDIFPCEAGGGYHFDFTRTWCLGYTTEEAQKIYDQVLSVYERITAELRLGELCRIYQERTCQMFEENGHATICSSPQTQVGFVHNLGHGLGLNVHELPSFRAGTGNDHRLEPGSVITIEPGLYYPDRNLGVRLENTIWVRPDGDFETLAEYPMDLVLQMKDYHFTE